MRKFSIKLRVTLWFTLMMVLIVAATLTFLISAGEYIELAGSKETLRRAVAEGFEELEWDDGRPDFDDLDTMVPVSLMLLAMPISGSIGHGIGLAMISYTVIKAFSGKANEVSALTYVISLLFVIKFFAVV